MKKFLSNFKFYIPGIVLFYFNQDVVIWSAQDLSIAWILYLIQVLALAYFYIKPKQQKLHYGLLVLLFIITLLVGLVHEFTSPTYLYKLFMYIMIFSMMRSLSFEDLQVSFYKVTFFFAVLSLGFYVCSGVLGIGGLLPVSFLGGAGASYSTNFLYSQLTEWAVRNCGIFREPGVYQIYLNIALLFYYNQNRNLLITPISIVLMLATITTLSSAGIVIMVTIVLMQYMQHTNRSLKSTILLVIFGFVASSIIMSNFDAIFYKIQSGVDESGSVFARYYSLIVPMRIWSDYPIFGCGAAEFNDLLYYYPINGERMHPGLITNCFTVNFATSGLFV